MGCIMLRKMPFILLIVISAVLVFDQFLPLDAKSILYATSLSIKSIIIFLLPMVIFGLLFKASVNLARNATSIIILIVIAVCCSNFLSTVISHFIGAWVYRFDLSLAVPQTLRGLMPYWSFDFPSFIPNDKAMFSGLVLGVLSTLLKPKVALRVSLIFDKVIGKILQLFTWVMPFFVAGFIIKLNYEGVINHIIQDYSMIFIVVAVAQLSYIMLIYLLANGFNISSFGRSLKNMLPAAIAGFSTMSSAAAMPLTILGAEKNAKDSDLARSIIPATVNIHLLGDCFAIPIFAYAVLKSSGMVEPVFIDYIIFAFYFVFAKFSVAAIPGGGIIVMLPILENYLGFNAEMMSLITALYILFDPVITAANVLGNGGFSMVITKLKLKPLLNKSTKELESRTDHNCS